MSRCNLCGGQVHDPKCSNAETPTFEGNSTQGASLAVQRDGSIYVFCGDDFYDFELSADDAQQLAIAVLSRRR